MKVFIYTVQPRKQNEKFPEREREREREREMVVSLNSGTFVTSLEQLRARDPTL